MTSQARTVSNVLRVALAVGLSLSWLLATGLPAEAFVSNSYVEKPCTAPCAPPTLKKARPLVIVVERNPNPPGTGKETIQVPTDLFFLGVPAPEPTPSESPAGEEEDSAQQGEVSSQQQEQAQQPAAKPINGKKPYYLPFLKPIEGRGGAREFWRFGTTIDPYSLPWAGGVVAPNGQYRLEHRTVSTVEGMQEPQDRRGADFHFTLSAPPAPQEAPLTAVADAAKKQTRVAWRHNAAPDVTSYTIARQLGDGKWQVVKEGVKPSDDGANALTDTVPKYGTYRYQITAFRPAGDGSGELLATTSPASEPLDVAKDDPSQPDPTGDDDDVSGGDGNGSGDGAGDTGTGGGSGSGSGSSPSFPSNNTSSNPGFGTTTEPFNPSVAAPDDFDDTFRGPLDFGVEPKSVTERVPVDIAQGGSSGSESTIEVLDRAIDQERVLPPVAGGLILVVSAAHVLRYLNE